VLKNILVSLLLLVSVQAFAFTQHADGSITLTAKDVAQLNDQLNLIAQQAYQAGVKDGVEAVKSNPKLCPKDI
jgi:hypothetical protein